MNISSLARTAAALTAAFAIAACADKTTPALIEQGELLNTELQTLVQENPKLLASAGASYADNRMSVDVTLADSLFSVAQISDPIFNYFTACEVKNHMTKNLEITVNALTEKEGVIDIKLTDAYGESRNYEVTAAALKRMIKSPLTQINFNEARDGLFAMLAASEAQFMPQEGHVKGYSTSFKGGFYAYNVEFENARYYKGLTTANLKARAIKVLEKRYENLGTFKPLVFAMYKSLGIDGFHLIYSAGDNAQQLKTTVTLSNIH